MTEQNQFWSYHEVQRGLVLLKPIKPILEGRGYIGGSFAAWMATRAVPSIKPADVDVYAISDQAALDMAHQLGEHLRSRWDEGPITYTFPARGDRLNLPIQVIKPNPEWQDFPLDILNSFDLSVSRAIFDPCKPDFILADGSIHDPGHAKLLRIRNPLRSLKRVMKYSARGARFTDWELIKLFSAWESLPPDRRGELMQEAHNLAFPPGVAEDEIEDGGPLGYAYDDDDYYEGE